jgi:hypothetical protein
MSLKTDHPLQIAHQMLSEPTNLDLDRIAQQLELAIIEIEALRALINLYEDEFHRELKSKLELAGGISACPDPVLAYTLQGEELLRARKQASQHFNRVFTLVPISRSAKPHTNSPPVPQDLLLRSGLGTPSSKSL